jgi:hypothetical protein
VAWSETGLEALRAFSAAGRGGVAMAVADTLLASTLDNETVAQIQIDVAQAMWSRGELNQIQTRVDAAGVRMELLDDPGVDRGVAFGIHQCSFFAFMVMRSRQEFRGHIRWDTTAISPTVGRADGGTLPGTPRQVNQVADRPPSTSNTVPEM